MIGENLEEKKKRRNDTGKKRKKKIRVVNQKVYGKS